MRSEFEKVFKDAYDYWIDDANTHRYEGAKGLADQVWQHQQSKVDELQKQIDFLNAQLGIQIDRCKAFGQELTSSRNYGDDLQKRVDAAERLLNIYKGCLYDLAVDDFKATNSAVALSALSELEQALKGGEA